jgi:hypothetical protein
MATNAEESINRFVEYTIKSGLVNRAELDAVLRSLEGSRGAYGKTLTALTSELIARNLLTAWQVAKLREEKYKGYFLDEFVLLDMLDHGLDFSRYLARDTRNGRLVALKVFPRGRRKSADAVNYEVEDL